MSESCGTCSLCCKLLKIEPEPEHSFLGKNWHEWCIYCKPGEEKPCTIYEKRPQACQLFQCVWLQSQERDDVPSLSAELKPKRSHVVLAQSQEDYFVMFAYVDPTWPSAWRMEPMRSHLITTANNGCTVVIVVNDDRYIMTKGRPTLKLKEGELQQLAKDVYITQQDGRVMIGVAEDQLSDKQIDLKPIDLNDIGIH